MFERSRPFRHSIVRRHRRLRSTPRQTACQVLSDHRGRTGGRWRPSSPCLRLVFPALLAERICDMHVLANHANAQTRMFFLCLIENCPARARLATVKAYFSNPRLSRFATAIELENSRYLIKTTRTFSRRDESHRYTPHSLSSPRHFTAWRLGAVGLTSLPSAAGLKNLSLRFTFSETSTSTPLTTPRFPCGSHQHLTRCSTWHRPL